MPDEPVKGIDLMKSVSEKQAHDMQQLMTDKRRRLKKMNKRPAM